MINLSKIKLQNDERGCLRNTAKRRKKKKERKKERQAATKRCQEIAKKGVGKSAAAQNEKTEVSAKKALKIRKSHRLNIAKYYENTNSE